jgi:hypothetical protein
MQAGAMSAHFGQNTPLSLQDAAELEALEFFEECVRNAAATASGGLAARKFSELMTMKHHERLASLREKLAKLSMAGAPADLTLEGGAA